MPTVRLRKGILPGIAREKSCADRQPARLQGFCYHGMVFHDRYLFMAFRPLHAQPPAALLRSDRTLRQLLGAARRLEQLQQRLEQQLQPAARPHCKVASWRDGVLLLIITSSEWATRLRYQQQRLLRLLQACPEFAGLQRILMRVRPTWQAPPGKRPALSLSGEAAQTLRSTAAGISDPRLRAALERLARHSEPADTGN